MTSPTTAPPPGGTTLLQDYCTATPLPADATDPAGVTRYMVSARSRGGDHVRLWPLRVQASGRQPGHPHLFRADGSGLTMAEQAQLLRMMRPLAHTVTAEAWQRLRAGQLDHDDEWTLGGDYWCALRVIHATLVPEATNAEAVLRWWLDAESDAATMAIMVRIIATTVDEGLLDVRPLEALAYLLREHAPGSWGLPL